MRGIGLFFIQLLLVTYASMNFVNGQNISKPASVADSTKKIDTSHKKQRSIASNAALRSAILPGLGQIYNKKYWKVPIVYGLIALPVSTFQYNSSWYKKTRFAYTARVTQDTANYAKIAPELLPISTSSLRLYRNQFRKNMDFSVLGILVMWGLNVVDATVDGHLRKFDIGDELTIGIKPTFLSGSGQVGLSATIQWGDKKTSK